MTAGAPPHPGAPQAIESYLAEVAAMLPGTARARRDIVAELRGGLLDAIDVYRSAGLTDDTAAQAAIREFGHPRQLASAFGPELAAGQARRVALTLVATGPLNLARNARPRTHRRGRGSQPGPAHPRPAGRPPLPGSPRRTVASAGKRAIAAARPRRRRG